MPIPLSCSGWDWVDSAEQLQRVTEELKGAQQIAVDLEHHALRSYLGITCLLQLSTGALHNLHPCFWKDSPLNDLKCQATSINLTKHDVLTGDKEYLVDALALHDHMHLLQDVLEDARIVKVAFLSCLCTALPASMMKHSIFLRVLSKAGVLDHLC